MREILKSALVLALLLFCWSLGGVAWTIWHIGTGLPNDFNARMWQLVTLIVLGIPTALVVSLLPKRYFLQGHGVGDKGKASISRTRKMTSTDIAVLLTMCFGGVMVQIFSKNVFGFDGFTDTIWPFSTFFALLGCGYFLDKPVVHRPTSGYKGSPSAGNRHRVRTRRRR